MKINPNSRIALADKRQKQANVSAVLQIFLKALAEVTPDDGGSRIIGDQWNFVHLRVNDGEFWLDLQSDEDQSVTVRIDGSISDPASWRVSNRQISGSDTIMDLAQYLLAVPGAPDAKELARP